MKVDETETEEGFFPPPWVVALTVDEARALYRILKHSPLPYNSDRSYLESAIRKLEKAT